MPRWDIEVIHEPSGQYMNFQADTDTEDENEVYKEILYELSIIPLGKVDDE